MSEKMHRPSPESNNQELNRSTPSQEDATKIPSRKTDAEIEEADKGKSSMSGSVEEPKSSENDDTDGDNGEKK